MQYMKPAFRNAAFYCHAFSRSLTLNSNPLHLVSPFGRPQTFRLAPPVSCFSSLMASSLEKLFDDFRVQYHGDWKSETQPVVSMLTFMHWFETGSLLEHKEAEEKLGCGLFLQEVVTNLNMIFILKNMGMAVRISRVSKAKELNNQMCVCFMSNELPRYVVNQVTAGDYDCLRKVLKFLTDLHAAFRMLNLRNDFLRKKHEEVYYDVKIRGLTPNGESVGNLEILESKDNLKLKL
ncbi:hypothetical protein JHK87_007688 [Glycine soja]|nr:hypothetical protein JHK87_007688 [Glycine soja]